MAFYTYTGVGYGFAPVTSFKVGQCVPVIAAGQKTVARIVDIKRAKLVGGKHTVVIEFAEITVPQLVQAYDECNVNASHGNIEVWS